MKKKFILIFVLLVILMPYSCENFNLLIDCDKCYSNLSDEYTIELKTTIDLENNCIPITLYKGTIDNGEVIAQYKVTSQPYYTLQVKFGEYYSAIAEYTKKGRIIYAVDGRKLIKKLDQNSCDESCYTIKGDVLDLRLK